jgi:hypothetical protein
MLMAGILIGNVPIGVQSIGGCHPIRIATLGSFEIMCFAPRYLI